MSTVSKECDVLGDMLQLEIEEASLRKQKLEQALRAVDAASSHLIETAARQEIEAYKRRHQSPSVSTSSTSKNWKASFHLLGDIVERLR